MFNVYIKTDRLHTSLLFVTHDEIANIVKAFDNGESQVFTNGEGTDLKGLKKIKIFTLENEEKFRQYLDHLAEKGDFDFNQFGPTYVAAERLSNFGEDVTRQFIKGNYGSKVGTKGSLARNREEKDGSQLLIFISHSAVDEHKVKALVDLIVKSFRLEADTIRCTTLPGYKHKVGSTTDAVLQKEIFDAKVFIGVITKNSIKSNYVTFELGARWGSRLPLIPLVCDPTGMDLLKAPLAGINALATLDNADIYQFISNLGEYLGIKPQDPSVINRDVDLFKKASADNAGQTESPSEIVLDNEFENSDQIIKEESLSEWPNDYAMQAHFIKTQKAAVQKLINNKPHDIPEDVFQQIRYKATKDWPRDFAMRLHTENDQIEAYRSVNT